MLAAVAAWLLTSLPPPDTVYLQPTQMALATAPVSTALATPPADPLHWQPLDQRELAGWRGPYWLRWQLPAATTPDAGSRALRLSLRAASRLYWNGQPLAANGRVGSTPAQEQPGRIDLLQVLPASSRSGTDELRVLASSQHQGYHFRSADALVVLAPVQVLYRHGLRPWLIAAFATGALGAACLYFLAVQRGRRRMPGAYLLLALGAVGLLLPVIEGWRSLLGYDYPWHAPRLFALLALHVAAAALLPAYLARHFAIRVPAGLAILYLLTLVVAAMVLPGFDAGSAGVLLLSLLVSTALLLRARGAQEDRGPLLALLLAGVSALLIAHGLFLDGPYFLLLAVLMVFLLVRHAEQLRALDQHNVRLREERAQLALQLLQRGIHPHWLMNTLTCLQELIEQAPSRASRLVESLAEQFDRLRDSSARQSVPLRDELALCRSHLDIVGVALDQPLALIVDAEDVDDSQLWLPPGVLHAQVENALTHAGARACAQRPFHLHVQRRHDHWVLELRSARGSAPRRGHGTGSRYIEASLAAAYAGQWRFEQGADEADWCGRIVLPCAS